jgi:hypothetical protein
LINRRHNSPGTGVGFGAGMNYFGGKLHGNHVYSVANMNDLQRIPPCLTPLMFWA